MVIGENGFGWLPYMLDHTDLEWEDWGRPLQRPTALSPALYAARIGPVTGVSCISPIVPFGDTASEWLAASTSTTASNNSGPDGTWRRLP